MIAVGLLSFLSGLSWPGAMLLAVCVIVALPVILAVAAILLFFGCLLIAGFGVLCIAAYEALERKGWL